MTGIETRTFATQLEIRGDGDGRTVTGLAAPYNTPTYIRHDGYMETFVPGSFQLAGAMGAPLFADHPNGTPHDERNMPVTPPGEYAEHDDGLYGRWRVPRTQAGDALLDGIGSKRLAALSVGFLGNPVEDIWSPDRSRVVRHGAILQHVAAVQRGAYPEAQVLSVRDAGAPYGDVEYADPGYQDDGKKRYPIDTEAHVKSAWSYINQADNAAQYSPENLAKIKSKIKAAAVKFGITIAEDEKRGLSGRAAQLLVARKKPPVTTTPMQAQLRVMETSRWHESYVDLADERRLVR